MCFSLEPALSCKAYLGRWGRLEATNVAYASVSVISNNVALWRWDYSHSIRARFLDVDFVQYSYNIGIVVQWALDLIQ